MTSRERFLTAARRGKPDRVPVTPYGGNFGATMAGVPLSVFSTNAEKMAAAQIYAWETLRHDVVVPQSDGYYIAEGFGCRIEQPYDRTPHLVQPAVPTLADVSKLKVPNPYRDGRMPVYLEAIERLRSHFGTEVAVRGTGTGPFSLASYLAGGTEYFLTEIAGAEADEDTDAQKRLFELMELSSNAVIAFLKAGLAAGSDVAQAGDSLASLSMISPAIYEKYVYPYECKLFSAINPIAHAQGAVTLLHICGDTRKILPLMAQTGADILEIDAKVNMGDARRLTAGRVALMGNLEPTSVLFQGTAEVVREAAMACMSACGAEDGAFLLGSGCEVVPKTPVENLRAMVTAARDYSEGVRK